MKNYIYDIESYPNFFCAVFRNNDEYKIFEISSRKNDYRDFLDFYTEDNIKYAMGFNNVRYDAQILHWLTLPKNFKKLCDKEGESIAKLIFEFSQKIISSGQEDDSDSSVSYPEWKFNVKQIDIYLINHYNNKNKATSLKWCEFTTNHPWVQDLPYRFDKVLSEDLLDEVIEYCKNDVDATRNFYMQEDNMNIVKLRISQDNEYPKLGLLNKPDSSVGETLFLHHMSEQMGVDKKELKEMRSHRGSFPVSDILLPYIKFKTPEFQAVLDFYKNANSGGLAYTVEYKGLKYEFGEGGIHASWDDRIFESDDEYLIMDVDVSSFYPNLFIMNDWRPEHLGDSFSKIYKSFYQERKKYPKGSAQNQSYKILLNGSYGKTGDQYSFLYDPKVMLQICVNGQLLIAMLAERASFIPYVTVIQANTDGLTFHIRRDKLDEFQELCKKWEKLTELELEYANYKKMVVSNVNNYIAQYENGKVKDKGGLYLINSEFHKNPSQRIVRIALRRYFLYNIPIRETIENHLSRKEDYEDGIKNNGIYDFCLGRKVKWNQKFVIMKGMNDIEVVGKVIRYYIANQGDGIMVKIYSDGRVEAVNKGYKHKMFMNYEDKSDYDVNFEYYINEAYKVTSLFDGGNPKQGFQLTLF